VGLLSIAVILGGAGITAHLVEVGGAVITTGRVVVETSSKRVQHKDGGIVKRIHVTDGSYVEAGALLVELDDVEQVSNLAILTARMQDLLAEEARLVAERDGLEALAFRTTFSEIMQGPDAEAVIDGQRRLMTARRLSREGRESQLAEQIKQFEKQIEGLSGQQKAKQEEIKLVAREFKDLAPLLEKGLIQQSRVTALRRDKARLDGERGGLISQIAQTQQAISERKVQILQIEEEMRAEVAEKLPVIRGEFTQLAEQRTALLEELRRLQIRAPRSGFVHQLEVHTEGGVVAPGQDLMFIVPQNDLLILEVQVAPTDVDQLTVDQEARVKFSGLDQRTTPELRGRVVTVSADLLQDPNTGASFYQARLALVDGELAKLNGNPIVPGMPVEAFLQTETRTILSYLVKPLTDNFARVFREG